MRSVCVPHFWQKNKSVGEGARTLDCCLVALHTQASCECTSSENEKFRPRISFASVCVIGRKKSHSIVRCAPHQGQFPSPKRLLFSFFDYMHIYLFYITFDNVYQTHRVPGERSSHRWMPRWILH